VGHEPTAQVARINQTAALRQQSLGLIPQLLHFVATKNAAEHDKTIRAPLAEVVFAQRVIGIDAQISFRWTG
jgi:hypothetical protein